MEADVLNSTEFAEYQAMQRPSSKVCPARSRTSVGAA